MSLDTFPSDWSTALVLVAHPDDPEYGMSAGIARWTSEGKRVVYGLATSGEVGIEGMPAEVAGPAREAEQIASAAVVGVTEVEFWGFPDSQVRNSPELRAKITEVIERVSPDIVLCTYGGAEFAPGFPNQSDHIEFAAALLDAYDEMTSPPSQLYWNGPGGTHAVDVDGFVEAAVESLACHSKYLEVLDPTTPVIEQARNQVATFTKPIDGFDAAHATSFTLMRPKS
ncbi:PIG-L deacetylase family protein [Gordonia sp. (in: high G+C Gram-positive bacteria)]|uniref:PIG-L deacetylase family protein n=1 Tax=Gordonia sp. (in: high G+C Gram-positive bacteria) TaxID=84139 RepID=UPI003C747AB9